MFSFLWKLNRAGMIDNCSIGRNNNSTALNVRGTGNRTRRKRSHTEITTQDRKNCGQNFQN